MKRPGIVPHCEDEGCSLGTLTYECPVCSRLTTDYDNWWRQDDSHILATCEYCGISFWLLGYGSTDLQLHSELLGQTQGAD